MQQASRQSRLMQLWPWLILLFCQSSAGFGFGKGNNDHLASIDFLKKVSAQRLIAGKVKIDGILDEEVWQQAQRAEGFVQHEPDEGQPGTETTIFQVAYDDHALYVAMVAYEKNPAEITSYLARRDRDIPCDWLAVIIDSYDDKRTAFAFGVNPAGVKLDGQMGNDGDLDYSWDGVWEVKTKIDPQGWIAEFKIPLSQLRFPNKAVQNWGFQAVRIKNKNHETDFWQFIPKDAGAFVSRFGRLNGLHHLPQPKRLQILPYLVARGNFYPQEVGNPFRTGPFMNPHLGGDLKYGVASNFTLDLTINPDFGQVEADPSEVNLTAYETFFREKRPFFIEGSQIFDYGIGIGDGDMGQETLFYSRRIGRSPHHEPEISDEGFIDQPQWTNIWAAAKLSGKTRHGWSIGLLEAVTGEMTAAIEDRGQRYEEIVEPWTNYFLVRAQKDFHAGRTNVGGIVTNVLRDIPSAHLNWLNRTATAGGLDFSHRTPNDNYMLQAVALGSCITGDPEAMVEAQTSSARYFQRPDNDYARYDPNRTALAGFGGSWYAGKIAGGNWRFGTGGVTRSPGFEVNDLGFMRSADQTIIFGHLGYRELKPGRVFRDYRINSSAYAVYNYGGDHLLSGANINFHLRWLNYWGIFAGVQKETQMFDTDFLRGGPGVMLPGRVRLWFGGFSDQQKRIAVEMFGNYSNDLHGSRSYEIAPEIEFRPSGRFDLSLSMGVNPAINDRQYVAEVGDDDGPHYVFARLNMKIVYLTSRLNYSFTPDLSIQFYGMPFIAAGRYTDYREVIAPRARTYAERFQSYSWEGNDDFNFKEFRSNLVVRWEYRPGSTIFFVWAHNQSAVVEHDGTFALRRDVRRLFGAPAENVLLVKVNRWFDF